MSVIVRIPTALRKLSDGEETLAAEGATVRAVLDDLKTSHPRLTSQLLDDSGKVRRFVNIFANDEDIRFLDDLDTELADGDELSIVPAIAGGADSTPRWHASASSPIARAPIAPVPTGGGPDTGTCRSRR